MPRTTDLPKEVIVARYEAGDTVQALARIYGRDFSTMRANLIRWGAKMRRRGPPRTVALNESYFDAVDTPEKAYWLGFILADGSARDSSSRKHGATLRINLAADEGRHLRELRKALGSDAEVKTGHHGESVYVDFHSARLVAALGRLEVVPNKTGRHGTPDIPGELLADMYRGYWDGDGWIGKEMVGVTGSPRFIADLEAWVCRSTGHTPSFRRYTPAVVEVRYGGRRKAAEVAAAMYEDGQPVLDRKCTAYRLLAAR